MLRLPRVAYPARWVFGTWAVAKDVEGGSCSTTVPVLYYYSVVLVVVYWIGVMFGGVELVGTMCGDRIKTGAQSSLAKVSNAMLRLISDICDIYVK